MDYIREQVALAEDHLARGNYWRAEWAFGRVYRRSGSLINRGNAKLGKAMCQYCGGDEPEAVKGMMEAIELYGNYIPFESTLKLEYQIAERLSHSKNSAPDPTFVRVNSQQKLETNVDSPNGVSVDSHGKVTDSSASTWDRLTGMPELGLKVFQHLARYAPYSDYGVLAVWRLAEINREQGEFKEAIKECDMFLTRYPDNKLCTQIRLTLIQSLLTLAKKAEGEHQYEVRAREEILREALASKDTVTNGALRWLRSHADAIEANHYLFLGEFYQRPAHPAKLEAGRYLKTLITKYKELPQAEGAKKLIDKLPDAVNSEVPQ